MKQNEKQTKRSFNENFVLFRSGGFSCCYNFLEVWGVRGIWKLLWIVAVLFLGSFLLYKGKAFGSVFGILLGIWFGVSGIREVPRRVNMGNAGPRIIPDFEDYWWQFWNTDIVWGFVFALFFLALGIFVFIKNRKAK